MKVLVQVRKQVNEEYNQDHEGRLMNPSFLGKVEPFMLLLRSTKYEVLLYSTKYLRTKIYNYLKIL